MDTLTREVTVNPPPLSRGPRYLPQGLLLVAALLWWVTVARADVSKMGAIGLMSVVGWTYFVGLAVLCAGITAELFRPVLREGVLGAFVVLLVVYLFGTSSAIEPVASLLDSWLHASFTGYILQHGAVLSSFDGRFSWPGAFSFAALMAAFVGHTDALSFLRWFPLFIELLYFIPVYVIGRHCDVSRRAAWLGMVLFYATDWIYQDYFSPQALDLLLYFIVLAVVLAGWRAHTRPTGRGLGGRVMLTRSMLSFERLNGDDAVGKWTPSTTLTVLVLLGVISLAMAMSHQLTPFALIVALCALLMTRRLGRPELILLVILFTVGWLSLGASNFWIGHLSLIFGSFGHLSSAVGSNVANRVTGNASHVFVTQLRIAIVGALYLAAGIGALRRYATTRSLEVLVAGALSLVVAQNYGGEGLMRAVLFVLPFTSLLAASMFFPRDRGAIRAWLPDLPWNRAMHRTLIGAVFVAVLGMSVATSVARGGNDAYESFTPGEVSAVAYTYSHAKPGQLVGSVIFYLPSAQQNFYRISNIVASNGGTPSLSQLRQNFLLARPNYIILSKAQDAWGTILAGYPTGWQASLSTYLQHHHYKVVASWSTAQVLRDELPIWGGTP